MHALIHFALAVVVAIVTILVVAFIFFMNAETDTTVSEIGKWRASDPISPHWYTQDQFTDLVRAYLQHEREHPEQEAWWSTASSAVSRA